MLAAAPSPEQGRRLTPARVASLLRRGGRQRNLQATEEHIVQAWRGEQLAARPAVVGAYAASTAALVAVITSLSAQVGVLAEQVGESFGRHPDAEIYLSQPGLGQILGARVLAEFGDDRNRYADAKARRNYSGMSPITKTSGKSRVVLARYARNRRLSDALHQVTITVSVAALTYAISRAQEVGWASATTVITLVLAAGSLAVFIIAERRSPAPLVPLPVTG